jgi:hypothetical protein
MGLSWYLDPLQLGCAGKGNPNVILRSVYLPVGMASLFSAPLPPASCQRLSSSSGFTRITRRFESDPHTGISRGVHRNAPLHLMGEGSLGGFSIYRMRLLMRRSYARLHGELWYGWDEISTQLPPTIVFENILPKGHRPYFLQPTRNPT